MRQIFAIFANFYQIREIKSSPKKKNLFSLFRISKTSWRINHKKLKICKTLIKLRFAKISPCEKSTGSQFAKLNLSEMLKNMTCENKSTRKFLSLRYVEYQSCFVVDLLTSFFIFSPSLSHLRIVLNFQLLYHVFK